MIQKCLRIKELTREPLNVNSDRENDARNNDAGKGLSEFFGEKGCNSAGSLFKGRRMNQTAERNSGAYVLILDRRPLCFLQETYMRFSKLENMIQFGRG